jgi:Glu-tRNA(Gln) amidotransferase subunit E-like FAD-binding protein
LIEVFATQTPHVFHLLQAKQLKDYENAVIAKRLEELDDDEVEALVEELNRDKF